MVLYSPYSKGYCIHRITKGKCINQSLEYLHRDLNRPRVTVVVSEKKFSSRTSASYTTTSKEKGHFPATGSIRESQMAPLKRETLLAEKRKDKRAMAYSECK